MAETASTSASGAERYFAQQQQDPEFRAAYVQARSQIDFVDTVIRRITERQLELGLSTTELARQAGIRERQLDHVLAVNRRGIRLDMVAAVAAAVGIELQVAVATDA